MNPSSVAEPDDSYLFGALLGSDGPTVDSDFVDCLLASLGQQAGPRALPSGEAFEPSQGSLPAGLHGSSDQTSSEVDGTLTQAARGPKAKQSNVVLAHNDRREKSKLAQRKFRMRQKERVQARGQELAEATEKLKKVSLERERLQQRNKLLEGALASATTAETARSSSDDTILSGGVHEPDMLDDIEPDASLLGQSVMLDDCSNIEIRTLNGRVYCLTSADVKGMTLEFAVSVWEDIVNTSAVLLAKAHGDLHSAAGQHLQDMVQQACKLKSFMNLYHWRLKTSLAMNKMGQGSPFLDTTPRSFQWDEILAAMSLTQSQVDSILELRQKYLACWVKMIEGRADLEQELQSLALTADSSISQSGQQKTLHDLAERLAKLWQETHAAIVPFFKSVTLQVMDALQVAHLIVQSYPWMPDSMGLAAHLAEQRGLPPIEDILATRFPSAYILSTAKPH